LEGDQPHGRLSQDDRKYRIHKRMLGTRAGQASSPRTTSALTGHRELCSKVLRTSTFTVDKINFN
jgi:hypothetical protein